MAQGISSSLNLALSRISYIQNNLNALENIQDDVFDIKNKAPDNSQKTQKNDFKTVFEQTKIDGKVKQDLDAPVSDDSIKDEISLIDEIKNENKLSLLDKLGEVNSKSKINPFDNALDDTFNIDDIISSVSEKYNIDSDFIKAIIKQESGFNPNAKSKKGAIGLMQLMPKTAKSLGIIDPYNPKENIEGGVRYLKGLLDKYDNNYELSLAAYNAGAGAVKRYGGIPPYKETKNYVEAIMNNYNKIKESKGLNI